MDRSDPYRPHGTMNPIRPLGLYVLDDEGFPVGGWATCLGAYLYDREARNALAKANADAAAQAAEAAKEVAIQAALAFAPYGRLAKLGKPVCRFFYDKRKWDTIRHAYWAARGGSDGMHLHHWFFPQRAGIPEGIRNAGWNLIEIPGWLNSTMNGRGIGNYIEWGLKALIPASGAGAGYVGWTTASYLLDN